MRFDAAVIGSGPAGATAARLLAQQGWSVALIERTEFPRRKVCGEFVSAATLPVLAACGIAREFIARAGPPVRTLAAYAGDFSVEAPMPRDADGWGRALGREHLDEMLRDAALDSGATLFQPAEVIRVTRQEDGHALTLRHTPGAAELTSRVLIAACGSWSSQGPFPVTAPYRPADLFGFKAHYRGGNLPPGVMPLLAFPGGYGGMVHTDGGRISVSCCIRRDALRRARMLHGGKAGDAVMSHLLATTAGARRALRGASPEDAVLGTGPIRPGIRARYQDGVYFIGNSAGETHPIIADGISMAIQSSWLLARCLLADGPRAGADYSRAWQRRFAPRLYAAAAFAHLAMNDRSRAIAARTIRAFPALLTWGALLSGKAAAPHAL